MAVPRGPAEIVALNQVISVVIQLRVKKTKPYLFQFRSLVQDLGFEDGLLLRFLRGG